jgi:hypothetical protein
MEGLEGGGQMGYLDRTQGIQVAVKLRTEREMREKVVDQLGE